MSRGNLNFRGDRTADFRPITSLYSLLAEIYSKSIGRATKARTRIKIAMPILIAAFNLRCRNDRYFYRTARSRLYYLARKSLNRTPPFIDSEMRVLLEIGNHKRRKEFFIRRTCRAQLCFSRFVGGNALLESCHAMKTLLKTSFNICPRWYIYLKNTSRGRETAAIIPFTFLAWQAKFRGSLIKTRELQYSCALVL